MDLHLARLLRQHNQLQDSLPRVLELNPKHSLILGLAEAVRARGAGEEAARISGDALAEVAWLLVDQARILEGESPADPAAFSRRLTLVVEQGLGLPAPDGRTPNGHTPGGDGGSPDGDVDHAAE
jgi:molecular chaperone HtpG